MPALVAMLRSPSSALQVLSLQGCGLDADAAEQLTTALAHNRSLHTLNLAENRGIGDAGAQHLATLLRSIDSALCTLTLRGCSIELAGVRALADAMEGSLRVTHQLHLQAPLMESPAIRQAMSPIEARCALFLAHD